MKSGKGQRFTACFLGIRRKTERLPKKLGSLSKRWRLELPIKILAGGSLSTSVSDVARHGIKPALAAFF